MRDASQDPIAAFEESVARPTAGVVTATPALGLMLDAHQRQLRELGAELRQARQTRGLSLEALAERLRLGQEQLQALEEGDTRRLPELVFVIAQLRRVAGALQLDLGDQLAQLRGRPSVATQAPSKPSPLQSAVALQHPPADPAVGMGVSSGSSRGGGRPVWWLAAGMAIPALALALTFVLVRRGELRTPIASPAQTPPANSSRPTPATTSEASLVLRAHEASWLEVRSGSGELLFRGSFHGVRRFPLQAGLRLLPGRPDLIEVVSTSEPARKLGPISAVVWYSFPAPALGPSTTPSSQAPQADR
ncbi:MAG: helix-turn-helix domain-containing protein [Synechococcaceae cyanobacterium]|nr:helix-turn-helix domain-containing protein [Synechococcaceae cyanobacterium]